MARAYQAGGAAALSVLTDERYFGGSLDDLREARAVCDLPVLRKDFLVDARQVREAGLAGADAILLIAACLDDAELVVLRDAARDWDLEILVEVHDDLELERVLAIGGFPLIGINNRNLKTFEVDLTTTERLCRKMAEMAEMADMADGPDAGIAEARPAGSKTGERPLVVSESGIRTSDDLARVGSWGCKAVLVGESLLVQPDLEQAVRVLLDRAADRDSSGRAG